MVRISAVGVWNLESQRLAEIKIVSTSGLAELTPCLVFGRLSKFTA